MKDVKVGFIGLGNVGSKIAENIIKNGYDLYVFDLNLKKSENLISKGNTVIIIEHNMDVIKKADFIIDLGPEGGKNGGNLLFQGNINKFLECKNSSTSNFLKKELT